MAEESSQKPEASESKPSELKTERPGRRYVQRSVRALIQWLPSGLAGAPLLSFALQQNWMMALLIFPVNVIAAVWAAYSDNFVDTMEGIYAERAKQDAKSLVAWMDSANQALKWQLSGFDAKYLKTQAIDCREYSTEGYNPDRTTLLMLEDVFVPLRLSGYGVGAEGLPALANRKRHRELESENLDIWELLRRSPRDPKCRQIVIQAQGGYGKTTLLRHIAVIYAKGKHGKYRAPKRIPILLRLRTYRDELSAKPIPSLPALITDRHLTTLSDKPLQPPPRWAENLLNRGRALVMLDGFDEVPIELRARVSAWITRQMATYERSTFILTSRPAGYRDYTAKRPALPIAIRKFNPEQQGEFIRQWYRCQETAVRRENAADIAQRVAKQRAEHLLTQLRQREELSHMAETPLLLNMLATFHRFDPGVDLPQQRVELYRGICKLQLEDRPKARGIDMLLPFDRNQAILQGLAWGMVQQNVSTARRDQLLGFLRKQPLLQDEAVLSEDWLKKIVDVSELLVEREPGEYEFPHLSFQGFFAANRLVAQQLVNPQQVNALILKQWSQSSPLWQETLLFFTGQLSPKALNQLISQAIQQGAESAELASRCLREYRNPEKLDPQLAQTIQTLTSRIANVIYANLEALLKAGQWREADQETYRLMITNPTVNKEEGSWFNPEDLENFPCEDLLILDRLWMKYSNGKFGFSVQTRIYVECGATLNGNYPGKEIWEKFGERVGWRKAADDWVSSTDLKYDPLYSPWGELPMVGCAGIFTAGGAISSLSWRLISCSTSRS